jgi:hypothetical protein
MKTKILNRKKIINLFIGENSAPKSCFLWILIIIVYTIIRINIVSIPLDRDEGIFGYAGQVILNNGIPYRDVIDIKPPVVYYINAIALLFIPPTSTAIHIFLHLYNFLTLIVLFYIGKIFCRSPIAGFGTATIYAIFSSLPTIQGFTASTEMFLLLPLSISLLLSLLAIYKDKWYFLLMSGACGAVAFWTKATAAILLLIVVLYILSASNHSSFRRDIRYLKMVKSLLLWISGFLFISLFISVYFAYHGIFNEFIYWCFIHNYYYSKNLSITQNLPVGYDILIEIVRSNFIVIVIGILGNIYAIIKKDNRGYFPLGFLFFSYLATIPGYTYRHYFAQLAPAIAIAGGTGFFFLFLLMKNKTVKVLISVTCAILIAIIPVINHTNYYIHYSPDQISRHFFGINPFPESPDIARYIRNNTHKDDTIFIYGSEAQILFYSQRESATSFALIYPLMSSYPRYKEFQKNAWKEIIQNSPKYIISTNIAQSFLYDGEADLWIKSKKNELLSRDYKLEAIMTVGNEKGIFLNLTKIKDYNSAVKINKLLHKYKYVVLIHKINKS